MEKETLIQIKDWRTHRLENLDDSLEKNEVRAAEAGSWGVPVGDAEPPYPLCLFWPEWNVERLGTFRGNGCRLLTAGDTGGPRTVALEASGKYKEHQF